MTPGGSPFISRLGKCAAHGSQRVKSLVAFVFKFLCIEQSHRRYVVSSNGIRTLLGLVDLEDEAARDAARQALAQVCITTNPAMMQYSEQLDCVRPLVQLLEHHHELLQFEGCMGLTNLLTANEELRSRAIQADAWRACRDLLFSDNALVQRAGIEAMCNLTMAPEILERFADGKADLEIKVFIGFCQSEDRSAASAAAGALAMLAACSDVAMKITASENFEHLFEALVDVKDPDVQHRLVCALAHLCAAEGCPLEAVAKIRGALKEGRERGFESPEAEKVAAHCLLDETGGSRHTPELPT